MPVMPPSYSRTEWFGPIGRVLDHGTYQQVKGRAHSQSGGGGARERDERQMEDCVTRRASDEGNDASLRHVSDRLRRCDERLHVRERTQPTATSEV